MTQLTIGARYRLKRDVERFPYFIAKAGMTGVAEFDDGDEACLKMDEPLPDCEEWGNCIQWVRADDANPFDDVEALP